jgi:DNA modification methylase
MTVSVMIGDCITSMQSMSEKSVQCCVTSPPYFGLRDYGVDGQIGLEDTPDAFVQRLVGVFKEVKRVLKDDGTLWLNIGDSYNGSGGQGTKPNIMSKEAAEGRGGKAIKVNGIKPKDLIGIPWRVAFALQADGWYLRQDIIWHKPNPMPESVKDRCTKAHEYIFLLSKSPRYYFDSSAMQEASADGAGRNRRSVWTINTKPYKGAHFATFPTDLIKPCILAGAAEGDTILDPFGGSGTTAGVAAKHNRHAIMCELNPEYAALMQDRINSVAGAQIEMKI